MSRRLATALLTSLLAAPSFAFEETVRRREVDAGVHVPVLTRAPELLTREEPEFPPEARKKGLTGQVRMLVTIGVDGTVTDVQVPAPVGDGFDEAAVAAVKRFTFRPAEVDFQPSPVTIEYVQHFTLTAAPAPEAAVEAPDAGLSPPGGPARLTGMLLVRGSRSPLVGGLLRCDEHEVEALSGEDGRFLLEVPSGLCTVRVSAADSETFTTKEELKPDETTEVNYYVWPKTVGYSSVVRGTKDRKEVVRRTLSRQELQKVPGSFGDPVRVIQNFPGVARAPFISGQLIVRGANPNQTLTFFDGVEIPLLFHLGGGPSVVNGEFLDKLDFYPGGFGARYGRAVGGVVDVTSRKGTADAFHGTVKVDIQDSSVYLEAPITKDISVAAAARRSYVDALIPLVLPRDPAGGSLLVLPVYWDYQVRVNGGAKRGEADRDGASSWSIFAFGSDDKLSVVATGGGRNRDVSVGFGTTFHRLVGTWSYRKGPVQLKVTPWAGFDLATIDFGTTQARLDQWSVGLRQDLQVEASPWLTLRTGLDIYNTLLVGTAELPNIGGTTYVSWPGAQPVASIQRVAANFNSFDGAAYLEADVKLWKFTLTPGVRASHALITDQTRSAVDPRLWVRFDPWERTSIKGSVGLYTQPPAGTDMQAPPFGTPGLTHERAFQASLGVWQKITDDINVDVTGFYNRRYENVVSPGPTVVNPDGTIVRQRFANEGLGRAYGLELMLRHEVTKNFFGWVAYTFSRSEERRAGSDEDYRLTSFDQTHILTLIASYRLPLGFEVGARFRYVTGRPRTPLAHQFDLFNAETNRYSSSFGPSRSARATDFHQLDIRVDKYFTFDTWTLNLYVDVQNVYNQQNVEQYLYDYRFRQEFAVPGIPILPVLGARITW